MEKNDDFYHSAPAIVTEAGACSARHRLPFRPPLRAAFTGLKGVPWLALATNSISPLLILDEEHVEYRVFRRRRRPYALITEVDLRLAFGTVNVVLSFADTFFSFTANVGNAERGQYVLSILASRGCTLTERANWHLSGPHSLSERR